jgi:flagellar hook-length control protein FliK
MQSKDNQLASGSTPNGLGETIQETGNLAAGQTVSVTEQADDVGTSQSEISNIIQPEVDLETNQKAVETKVVNQAAVKKPEGNDPISLMELSSEAVDLQDVTVDPKTIKTEAEKQQRVDQVAKSVVDLDGSAKGKDIKIDIREGLSQSETTTQKPTETAAKEIEFAKVQVDQMTKSNTITEPARMAEALPRQTINQMSEQIEMLIQQGRSSLRLQLSPEHLGRIDIRLVNSGHGLGVTVLTEQAETGKMLEAQLDQLRQTLQDAGIQLSHLNVGQQSPGSKNAWLMQDHKTRFLTRASQVQSVDEQEISSTPTRLRTETGVDYRI